MCVCVWVYVCECMFVCGCLSVLWILQYIDFNILLLLLYINVHIILLYMHEYNMYNVKHVQIIHSNARSIYYTYIIWPICYNILYPFKIDYSYISYT